MEPPIIGLIGIAGMLALMFLGMPIGIAMCLAGVVGVGILTSMDMGISLLGIIPFTTGTTYFFSVLPLFVVMGLLAYEGGLTTELFDSAYKLLGHLPGGLPMSVIWADAGFAAISGESLAASMFMTKIALPEMRRYKYDDKLATGSIAVGGTLGILIPPSIGFILYGLITETSIGKLFIAGILPGILLSLLFMATIAIWIKLRPSVTERAPAFSWRERLIGFKSVWPVVVLFLAVMGGIYSGLCTPVEAGALGAFFAVLIALVKRRLTRKGFSTAIRDTVQIMGMLFIILIGAWVFNFFMASSRLPMEAASFVLSLELGPYGVLALISLTLLALGCVMNVGPMILLTMPIFFPIVTAVGFDPVWFGVVSVILSECGLITPPVGINVYAVAGVATDVPLFDIFKGVLPFLGALLVGLAIITIFPQICTFLPNLMMK